MSSFGERLRQERLSRGMTIEQIAAATGIGVDYLGALERSDFQALPGRAFGKLHIRAYAETLGFDPREIIEQYDQEREGWQGEPAGTSPATRASIPASRRRTTSRPLVVLAMGLALVVLLAGAAGVYSLFFRARAEAGEAVQDTPAAEASSAPPAPAMPAAPPGPSPRPRTGPPRETSVRPTAASGPLSVAEYGVGRRMENRRLVSEEVRFRSGEAALFSTRVVGGKAGGHVVHVWLHEGRVQQTIPLRLGGPDWRTHSRKTLYRTGSWAVEARDEMGRVLARVEVLCEPARP